VRNCGMLTRAGALGDNVLIGLDDRSQDKRTFLEVLERSISKFRAIDGPSVQHSMWWLILHWFGNISHVFTG